MISMPVSVGRSHCCPGVQEQEGQAQSCHEQQRHDAKGDAGKGFDHAGSHCCGFVTNYCDQWQQRTEPERNDEDVYKQQSTQERTWLKDFGMPDLREGAQGHRDAQEPQH